MNHRIKNNLTMVASLINLEAKNAKGVDPKRVTGRVLAIAQVHDALYAADDGKAINLGETLRRLCANPALAAPAENVQITCSAADLWVSPDVSTALSIVTAELLTNAIKHAFPYRMPGKIWVRLSKDDSFGHLTVQDNGAGISDTSRQSGLGLIRMLLDQIGARISSLKSKTGTGFEITFSIDELINDETVAQGTEAPDEGNA
jgi:two-component sensor histidine kinase